MKFGSGALLSWSILLVGCGGPHPKPKTESPAPPTPNEKTSGLSPAILDKCKNATVLVGNFQDGKIFSSGSGFVAGDGKTIYTNKHVVTGSDDTVDDCKLVFFPGTSRVRVVNVKANQITVYSEAKRSDPEYYKHDVAKIRLEAQVSDPLDTGDLALVRETQDSWALGFPNGLSIRTESSELPSVTVHSMKVERIEKKEDKTLVLQFGGSATFGNSGGPVVNSSGEVIGIIQALGDSRSSIIYGVPIWVAKDIGSAQQAKDDFLKPISGSIGGKPDHSKETERITSNGVSALSTVYLTESDLQGKSGITLTLLRNEPFARRGYRFSRSELRSAFNSFDWYHPRTKNLEAVEADFNSREKHNIDLISRYQKANGLDW